MNEGGLFGEREGWHLPGFDTSSWATRDLSEGLPGGGAGVGFFVTTFDLAFPADTDVLASFQFETTNTQLYRALLFVNGWMFGKASFVTLITNDSSAYVRSEADGEFRTACCELRSADEVSGPAWYSGLQLEEVSIYYFSRRWRFEG